MADVQMQIVVGDGFSSVLERFDRLLGVVDKISNDTSKSVDKLTSVVEKLGNSANGAGDSGREAAAATEEFKESADKASASSVSFSDSLQKNVLCVPSDRSHRADRETGDRGRERANESDRRVRQQGRIAVQFIYE